MDGVIERTQHPGNVFQGSLFFSPLLKGKEGFAFEIKNKKVVPRPKDLAKVVIPMAPECGDGGSHGPKVFKEIKNLGLRILPSNIALFGKFD